MPADAGTNKTALRLVFDDFYSQIRAKRPAALSNIVEGLDRATRRLAADPAAAEALATLRDLAAAQLAATTNSPVLVNTSGAPGASQLLGYLPGDSANAEPSSPPSSSAFGASSPEPSRLKQMQSDGQDGVSGADVTLSGGVLRDEEGGAEAATDGSPHGERLGLTEVLRDRIADGHPDVLPQLQQIVALAKAAIVESDPQLSAKLATVSLPAGQHQASAVSFGVVYPFTGIWQLHVHRCEALFAVGALHRGFAARDG